MNCSWHTTKDCKTNFFFGFFRRDINHLEWHAETHWHHTSMKPYKWLRLQLPIHFESSIDTQKGAEFIEDNESHSFFVKFYIGGWPVHTPRHPIRLIAKYFKLLSKFLLFTLSVEHFYELVLHCFVSPRKLYGILFNIFFINRNSHLVNIAQDISHIGVSNSAVFCELKKSSSKVLTMLASI